MLEIQLQDGRMGTLIRVQEDAIWQTGQISTTLLPEWERPRHVEVLPPPCQQDIYPLLAEFELSDGQISRFTFREIFERLEPITHTFFRGRRLRELGMLPRFSLEEEERVYVDPEENPPGIDYQMSHESFVRENPDLLVHSREARSWYWETEPQERTQWLMYHPESVYNQPLISYSVQPFHLEAKQAREARFQLLMQLVHQVYELLKEAEPPYPVLTLELDLPTLRRQEVVVGQEESQVTVYVRGMAKRPRRVLLEPGPGIKAVWKGRSLKTPGALVTRLFKETFSLRRRWLNLVNQLSQGKLAKVDKPRQLASARLMGVFLTQEQLHHFRQAIAWLCDRFQIPNSERPRLREDYPVSENRVNDLMEEAEKLKAQIQVLERALEASVVSWQVQKTQRQLTYLTRRRRQVLEQQGQTLLQLVQQDEKLTPQLLSTAASHQEALRQELETRLRHLEEELGRLLDPAHPDFQAEMKAATQALGKERLTQQVERLRQELQSRASLGWILELQERLRTLERRYELASARVERPCDFV